MTEELQIVSEMIQLSKSMKTLREAKSKVTEVNQILLQMVPDTRKKLKLAENELLVQIEICRNMISSRFKKHPMYDESIHMDIDYISQADIASKFVYCSRYQPNDIDSSDQQYYINLETGIIVTESEIPEDKRDR